MRYSRRSRRSCNPCGRKSKQTNKNPMMSPREIFQAARNPQNSYLNPWKGAPDAVGHNTRTHSVWETLLHYLTTLGVLFHWGRKDFFPPHSICPEWIRLLCTEPSDYVKNVQMPVVFPTICINKQISAQSSQEHSRTNHWSMFLKGPRGEISPSFHHVALKSSGMQELG